MMLIVGFVDGFGKAEQAFGHDQLPLMLDLKGFLRGQLMLSHVLSLVGGQMQPGGVNTGAGGDEY